MTLQKASFPSIDEIQEFLVFSITSVCETMIQTGPEFIRRFSHEELVGEHSPFYKAGSKDPLIVGSIGFAGEANGMVYLYMDEILARKITGTMTGLDTAELDMVRDVIGEICNMAVGTFKNRLSDLGFPARLTLPTVIHGCNLGVDSSPRAKREVFHFMLFEAPLVIDLFMEEE